MADDSLLQKASSSASSSDVDSAAAISSRDLVAAEKGSSEEAKMLEFSGDEETLIIRMFNLVGHRWSLIAGRIPGRSAEEIEKFWKSRHSSTNQSN